MKSEVWDEYLDTCLFAYNTSQHESTKYTPFHLMFGRLPYLPVEVASEVKPPEELLMQFGKLPDINSDNLELLSGKHQLPLEQVLANIKKAQEKQKRYYDLKHTKPSAYRVGASVLLKDFTRRKRKGGKLDMRWFGPFRITRILGNGLYLLTSTEYGAEVKRVHGTHLKPYNTSSSSPTHSSELMPAGISFMLYMLSFKN